MTKIISSLIVLCVFAIASPNYASDWLYVASSIDEDKFFYIDFDSIKINPPVVTFWYKVTEKTSPRNADYEKAKEAIEKLLGYSNAFSFSIYKSPYFATKDYTEKISPYNEKMKSRCSINCKEGIVAIRDNIEYQSDGKVSSTWSKTEKELLWRGIVPDSIIDAFMRGLCADNKPRPSLEEFLRLHK